LTIQAQSVSDYNPISHWSCDETSGVRLDSNTVSGNDLSSINSVSYQSGLLSNACDLESSSSMYLTINDGSQTGLDFSTAMSLVAFIKLESLPINNADGMPLASKLRSSGNGRQYAFQLRQESSVHKTGVTLFEDGAGAGDADFYKVTWTPSTATWYCMAYTYDTNVVKMYVDGTQVGSNQTSIVTSMQNTASNFDIGTYNLGSYFDGLIDEIAIFDYALSATEVSDLCNGGTPLPYSPVATSSPTTTSTSTVSMDDTNFILIVIAFVLFFILIGSAFSLIRK